MKFFVSGLSGVETTLGVRGFPVTYYPVDYPFFGVNTEAGCSGLRVAAGLKALGDDVDFLTVIGDDFNGERVLNAVRGMGLSDKRIVKTLKSTVEAVALQELPFGRRQLYCDLKDAQEISIDADSCRDGLIKADVCVLCNVNFNRRLLVEARALGKKIATDVQNLSDIRDGFNADFIENADYLFLSDEGVSTSPREFLTALAARCGAEIIVMGLAEDGLLCFDRASSDIIELKAYNVGDVITAGAGPALLSGFLHFYGAYPLVDALKRAQAFAALKLVKNGSGGGFPTAEETEKLIINSEL